MQYTYRLFQELLSTIEKLHLEGKYGGSFRTLVNLFETYLKSRNENSVLLWLSYKRDDIHPSNDDWQNVRVLYRIVFYVLYCFVCMSFIFLYFIAFILYCIL